MTPQEESMLGDLIRRVQQTQLTEKDPDAQEYLDQQLGNNPDSLYILAQTVLVQKYALEQAQKQLEQLKQQAQQPARSGSFLGNLFGHGQQEAPQRPAIAAQQQQYAPPPPPPYTPVSQPAYTTYPAPGYAPQYAPAPGGGSSFLRSAATTAAGVAAGALAFEGVESLMHGFGHSAGFGGGGFGGNEFGGFGGGGFGERPIEENVVNNYYDTPGAEHGAGGFGDHESNFSSNAGNDQGSGLHDAGFGNSDNDIQPELDQADDVQVGDEDGSSFDDASGNDTGDFGGGDDSNFV
jgi:hypothetical protein